MRTIIPGSGKRVTERALEYEQGPVPAVTAQGVISTTVPFGTSR